MEKWVLDDGKVDENDAPAESTPLQYPRSEAAREGTYPKFEEASEGMDENDGGTA